MHARVRARRDYMRAHRAHAGTCASARAHDGNNIIFNNAEKRLLILYYALNYRS